MILDRVGKRERGCERLKRSEKGFKKRDNYGRECSRAFIF
jgi:hypothetical protein